MSFRHTNKPHQRPARKLLGLLVLGTLLLALVPMALAVAQPPPPLEPMSAGVEVRETMPAAPDAVLWDQPVSVVNPAAYANQDFGPANDASDWFIADDFVNDVPWAIDIIFVPGNTYNVGCDLTDASALNWEIYADGGGAPDGDPWGGGNPPLWSLSLPPTDAQVALSAGIDGFQSDVTLMLAAPVPLPAGTWWLVFYPSIVFDQGTHTCQSGRHPSDTANGYIAQVIQPEGGQGFPTVWTPVTDPSTYGIAQTDFAFRLGGIPTAVELASFGVAAQASAILLEWETASELDNLGFNVYRSQAAEGERVQLNAALIPAQNPGTPLGATYRFLDDAAAPGITYYYWLEDVDANGAATVHGPVSGQLQPLRRLLPARPRLVPAGPGLQSR